MTVLIDRNTVDYTSQPFEVGTQVTVYASNLAGDDYVEFEIVTITPARSVECGCPPFPVVMPSINWSSSLRCCGEPIRLTAEQPFVLIDHPQAAKIRARLVTSEVGWTDKTVWFEPTAVYFPNDRMRGCACS